MARRKNEALLANAGGEASTMVEEALENSGDNGHGDIDSVQTVHDKILTPGTKENAEFQKRQANVRIGMIRIETPQPQIINVRVKGSTELVTHPFSVKAMRQIEETQMTEKTKVKAPRKPKNPIEEMFWSFHWGMGIPNGFTQTSEKEGWCEGIPTFPLIAIKSAIVDTIKMQQPEYYKKDLQRILFIRGFENLHHAPIEFDPAQMHGRLDYVKLANGNPDIRYRPEFYPWALSFQVEYMPNFWNEKTILDAIQSAGYLNGVGEFRIERGGSFGRFCIDSELTGKADLFERIGRAQPKRLNLAVTKQGS